MKKKTGVKAHAHCMHMHGTNAIKLLMLLCSIVDACTKARVTWTNKPTVICLYLCMYVRSNMGGPSEGARLHRNLPVRIWEGGEGGVISAAAWEERCKLQLGYGRITELLLSSAAMMNIRERMARATKIAPSEAPAEQCNGHDGNLPQGTGKTGKR